MADPKVEKALTAQAVNDLRNPVAFNQDMKNIERVENLPEPQGMAAAQLDMAAHKQQWEKTFTMAALKDINDPEKLAKDLKAIAQLEGFSDSIVEHGKPWVDKAMADIKDPAKFAQDMKALGQFGNLPKPDSLTPEQKDMVAHKEQWEKTFTLAASNDAGDPEKFAKDIQALARLEVTASMVDASHASVPGATPRASDPALTREGSANELKRTSPGVRII